MKNQFVVPQFIEVESKIIGPISGRQFIILLVSGGLSYVEFSLFQSAAIFIPLVLVTMGGGALLAFAKVNGQPMHYVLLNLGQTLRRPGLRVWKREIARTKTKQSDGDVIKAPIAPKPMASRSRLAEMSLLVDTGGAYQGDNELNGSQK